MSDSSTSTAAHKDAVAAVFSVWNDQDYQKLDAHMSPDFRRKGVDMDVEGRDAMKDFMRTVHEIYSDFHIDLNESAHEGDKAFTQWTITGKLRENGKSFSVDGVTMLRFENGLITKEMAFWDTAAANAQVGVESVAHVR
jgi:steroid delta-isomerase-like uncharacterized protein